MSLLKGTFAPKLVIVKAGMADLTITLTGFGKDSWEDYRPDVLTHELDDGTLRRKLRGFRYRAQIHWDGITGEQLVTLARLYHEVDVNGMPGYDQVRFYPNSVDKPLHYELVTIDDDDIHLAYWQLLAMEDFTLKLIGVKRCDWVPMVLADLLVWGNISLQFSAVADLVFDDQT